MIIYRSLYTIAYLGCPLGFQAFARGQRGCGPQATYSPTSIACRSCALIQRVAPGSCTQSCCSVTETGKILTTNKKFSTARFAACVCCGGGLYTARSFYVAFDELVVKAVVPLALVRPPLAGRSRPPPSPLVWSHWVTPQCSSAIVRSPLLRRHRRAALRLQTAWACLQIVF
jgi:hypothetical protein